MRLVLQLRSLAGLVLLLAVAGADDTTTTTTAAVVATSTACAAQSILDACIETTTAYLSLCASNDYSCLCDKYTAIMTCFANCPSDSRQYEYESQRQLYCANASAFPSTTSTSKSNDSAATVPVSQTTVHPTATGSSDDDDDEDDKKTTTSKATHTATSTEAFPLSSGNAAPGMDRMMAADGGAGAGALAAFAGLAVAALL
ncbi:hypothetical protein F5Y17DRAFT_458289 [Xylariaceae sp. FL0594]|nr:hypothetical protein F5Y17DRAFT_458289 [Xylariaceae sp. FL0594]